MAVRRFVCSRQVECLVEIDAENIQDVLARLPGTEDELVETADGVAFGSQWSIQLDGVNGQPQSFDDADVAEAKKSAKSMLPGDM
jgi:hypothetical protein